ncbi:hypothetical protein LIER_01736 [Lithospermum erythrorhizon]|uniref:Agenet domain-containing protein n=1 Tax=Lithospermum erythrorhizon TaxID=34254 RepID=A0AAV3NQP0_LITER
MPMDNNDNHYPGLSEENSKITSVLHPYGLPKFDFDHSHIRFDSLVENEGFLGISSREDDNWIEDFSRGNSGIEFGTSAAECCSIPRHVDVWSEATSSESVEMLLKSVGQEEMLPGESVIEESIACDELSTLEKQTELNPRPAGNGGPKVQPSDNSSGLNQGNEDVDIDAKCPSFTQVELSASGSSVNLESSLDLPECNPQNKDSCQTKPDTSHNESLDHDMKGTLVLPTQRCSDSSLQYVMEDVEFLNGQDRSSAKPLENPSNESTQNNACNVNDASVCRIPDIIHQSMSEFSVFVSPNADATQNFEEPSSIPTKVESSLPTTKGNSQDLQSVESCLNSKDLALPESLEIKHFTDICEKSIGGSEGDLSLNKKATSSSGVESLAIKHSTDICEMSIGGSEGDLKGNKQAATSSRGVEALGVDVECEQLKDIPSPTSHTESSVEYKERSQVDKGVSTITSEGYIPGTELELGIHIIVDPVNHDDNLQVLSDASQSVAEHVAENLIERNGARENPEDTVLSSVSSEMVMSVEDTSQSVAEHVAENLTERNDAMENHEVTVLSSEIGMSVEVANSAKQDPGDASPKPVILDNDEPRLPTSSLDEEVERKIDVEQTSESDLPSTLKSESNIGSNGSNTASHEMSHGTTVYMGEQNEELNLPSDVEPVHLDKIADTVTDAMLEEETPSLKFPSQVDSETGTVSLAERNFDGNVSAEEEIREDSSRPSTESLDAASLNEGVMGQTKVALGFSDTKDLDGLPRDSNVVVADCPEAVLVVKHIQTKIDNSFQAQLSENSGGGCLAGADKPSHNIASVTSCSKVAEPDERMTEDHIDSAAEQLSDSTPKAGEVLSVPKNEGASEGSREERNFSFDVPPVAEKESGSMHSGSRKNHEGRKVPQVTSIVTEAGSASVGAKTTSDRKTRRGSAKSTKKNAKGNNVKQTEDNASRTLLSHSGPAQLIQFGVGLTEPRNSTTPISTSNLPDLNTAVPTSAICHQPFTDLQQLQLRAQIFVYGSLIQGTAPDEGCMASAFGASDGGRTSWEPKWRACIERLHSQNAVSNNLSTPIQSHLGSKGQHKSSKQSAPRSKAVPSPASIFCTREIPSVNVKPMVPLSSPLWNLSAPSSDGPPLSNVVRGAPLALPPLHPCQTPPAQKHGGLTSWLSPAPIPGPWVPSSRSSAFDSSARYSSSPSAEAVKLTLPNDSSLSTSSSMNHAFNALVSHLGVSSNLVQDSSMQKLTSSPAGSKSRKRRKSNTTEESPQNSLLATLAIPHSDAIISNSSKKSPAVGRLSSIFSNPSASHIDGHFSTTVAVTGSPIVTVNPVQIRELHMGELKQVEKAKLDGEEAMAHAADLVSRCQDVWRTLEEQRNSSLAPDHELQLTSSAAAVAAAASVAKAAAAAAKIASIAALHFHQVAIQVLHENSVHPQESEYSVCDVSNNLSDATPASILRGGNGNDAPNSIISAAREAARRRVEDALAASQHAENLDAIVKAAELAAEAVSQAGRVVSMGKPLPLSALLEGGPENYWRGDLQLANYSTEKGDKKDLGSSEEVCKQSEGPSGLEVCTMAVGSSLPKDIARDMCMNTRVDEAISASHLSGEKGISGKRDSPAPDHTGAGSLASELADAERVPLQDARGSGQRYSNDDVIKENCIVEVFKDGGCFKGGWYSAKVLSLNDEKTLVCFTDLQSDKESDLPREWIPLEGEGNKVPNIRVPHPISGVHFDRTRKRGRAALTEYQWSVGDSVDAWCEDCWREGVITEQNSTDLTTFTVHFPAHGKTSVVKAWHIRPTLTWKNGKWIELLNSKRSAPSQSDTPRGKRSRLGSPIEVEGKREIPKTVDNLQLGNVDDPKLLPLSSTEQVFNIGSNRGDHKVEAPRMMRSGLQKEGLKFFGVPRPGKKRKFMEVSKHIVSERSSKNDVPNDSSKLSKYLMPRGTGSRGFRNGAKTDVKEKQLAESRLKAPNTGKLPGISSLTLSQKENSTSVVSRPREITSRSHTVKGSISNNARGSSDLNRVAIDVSVPTESLPSERNKKASKNINPERTTKGKLAVAGGRTEGAAEDTLLPDSTEPRRSNRKIQPTSRLLEGLQSSLITSKIPSVSHRLHSKGASRGTSNRH